MFGLDMYGTVILVVTVALAGLTGAKIPHFLASKWGLSNDNRCFLMWVGGIACAIMLAYMSVPAMHYGSYLYGLVVLVGAVPAVGFIWAYVVGMLLAFERIITGLLNKLDGAISASASKS